jgi:hypothetical protein
MKRVYTHLTILALALMTLPAFAQYPGSTSDLCVGIYNGSFSNGQGVTFAMARSGPTNGITVTVSHLGRTYRGVGTCDLIATGAHAEFDVATPQPVTHIVDVQMDGRMTGYQINGITFSLARADGAPGYNTADLCDGTFVGAYSNGRAVTMILARTDVNHVNATFYFMGRSYTGVGTCTAGPNGAHVQVDLNVANRATHIGDIALDGRMTGYQVGGLTFSVQRQ